MKKRHLVFVQKRDPFVRGLPVGNDIINLVKAKQPDKSNPVKLGMVGQKDGFARLLPHKNLKLAFGFVGIA
ncbi:hypothetical protein D3C87_1890290 [compost metagenome]